VRIRVLGSCAGGGLPQWNCGCDLCVRARAGDPRVPPRGQPSLAVSADGTRWSLLNAAPDVRHQLADAPALHPRPGTRDLPLDTVVLTNAELDHVLGLLVLREALSYRIASTAWVRSALLDHNACFGLLEPAWGAFPLDRPFPLDPAGRLEARFFPAPGKVPGFLRDRVAAGPECNVGVRVTETDTGRRLVFVPGTREIDAGVRAELEAADCAFVDGTFHTADELQRLRPGAPDAFAMAHVPVTGPRGSLPELEKLAGRRLYIHMNNTNPLLDAGSPETLGAARAGVEVAMDGMELEL
jgi:pyrroloquinoline quinone biosynthesis protein B